MAANPAATAETNNFDPASNPETCDSFAPQHSKKEGSYPIPG
jgi:hypothetical protein